MMGFMIYFAINIRFLRFLRFFEKWSELGKIGKNGEKCLSQNPHFYTTDTNHCGKRRNCSLRAISPFPTVFSKDLYCRHVKTRDCSGEG